MTKRNWGITGKCYEPPPLPSGRSRRSRRVERINYVLASLLIIIVAVGSLLILLHTASTSP